MIGNVYIAVDISGSKYCAALYKNLLNPKKIDSVEGEIVGIYNEDISKIFKSIDSLKNENIEAIAIGLPGIIDSSRTYAEAYSMQPDWEKEPIVQDFKDRFDTHIFLENNCVVAALAESQYAYGNSQDLLFVEWGNGLSGASVNIISGKIHLEPVELSHQVIYPSGYRCSCGQKGCLNLYCTAVGFRDTFGRELDTLSEGEWKRLTDRMTWGIINLLAIRKTSLLVFGGDLPTSRYRRVMHIRDNLREKFKLYKLPKFKISKIGEDVRLLGCIALIHNKLNRNLN